MNREDYLFLALLTVLFILLLFNVKTEYIYASAITAEDPEELHIIIGHLEDMQSKQAEYEAEKNTFMANVQAQLETADKFMSGVSNLLVWLVALTAFQVGLMVTLVFAVSWGKR